jgi:hypothetical protein
MNRNIFSLGGAWAEMLEGSLARKLAQIGHYNLGNPQYNISFEQFRKDIEVDKGTPEENLQAEYRELIADTKQASSVLNKLRWYIRHAGIVYIETGMLDTGFGHEVLVSAERYRVPAYGVGVTAATSLLAPAYLKGIIYPATPDDLVQLALQTFPVEHQRREAQKQPAEEQTTDKQPPKKERQHKGISANPVF